MNIEREPTADRWELGSSLFELLLQLPTPMCVLTGPKHRFMFVNAAYVQLARRNSAESLLEKPIREALPELEGQGFFELLDQVYRSGKPYVGNQVAGTLEREGTHEQERAYFNFVYQPIRGKDGQVKGILVQATEVTEQVRARLEGEHREQILHRQWSELEAIYRTAPVGLALIHPKTFEFLRANNIQSEIAGLPVEELLGKTMRQVGPAIAEEVEALFHRALNGQPVESSEVGVELPDHPGVHRRWMMSCSPIYAEDGQVEALSCMTLDVTAQKKVEAALRESEARLRAMYNTSLEYIGILTPDGRILDCNRASLAFANNVREDVLGLYFWDSPWFGYTSGAPRMCRDAVRRAAAGEMVRLEFPLTRPNGEVIHFDFSLCPVRNAQGEIEFLIPEGRDITDLKRTQAALIQSEKLAAVGRLASSVAHEINNPLESVTNLIYLARQYSSVPQVQSFLDTADQELRRMGIIANQTLRFHKQPSSPVAIGGADLFSSVLRIYEGRLKNLHIRVETSRLSNNEVTCFQADIRQVLLNVVGNAVDAMKDGGRLIIRSRVATDWKSGRKGLVLMVADTGQGIAPDAKRRIFEPFFTTKGYSGNGLGLWISAEIMARHQGGIHVRSSQGARHHGTVVALFLPFEAAPAAVQS